MCKSEVYVAYFMGLGPCDGDLKEEVLPDRSTNIKPL